ncbi:YjiH family protein [Sporosarcina trichiuri]|uniref:YjiH family protein n=1 Tax=Sporosarcina trichiuri TaxID=3056445 RepID=UPI0025B55897|nr:YjiH family protein [Sporosarcina sp. 0.2-SM1T-5]WJY26577.1 YjiH family protein [Sporosarcina sp. 0.2-SM1T-5]
MKKASLSNWLLFLLPSLAGILLFMVPMKFGGEWLVPVAVLADWLSGLVEPIMPFAAMVLIIISAVGSVIYLFIPFKDEENPTFPEKLFKMTPFWTLTRVVGAVFAVMVTFQLGPEAIWSENTGGMLLSPDGLVSFLYTIFLFAGLFLPLLLNFGLLDFFGTMMVKIMRPLFKLPGRSSIDALTSWVGDGTIGVLLTSQQYEEGHYTKREAAVIATTFSIVSITFSLVIIREVNLEQYFVPFYATVALVGVVLGLIMPRIYPLSRKPDEHIDGSPQDDSEKKIPEGYNVVTHGLKSALETADKNRSLGKMAGDGFRNVLDMWLGVAPIVMAFGTIATMLAEYTSLFTILGKPFVPLLNVLGIPEAAEAGSLMIVGITDMFLPALLANGLLTEPITLFTVATISVVQLIYLSEVGGLILGTKIPVNLWDLIVIFLIRTLIALPIVAGVAHLIF